jgi:hypothetical protein
VNPHSCGIHTFGAVKWPAIHPASLVDGKGATLVA